jgi:hypothetical protein
VITATPQLDAALRRRLERLTACDEDYWSFKGNSAREHGHGLFQYPAMMVPQMARAVLAEACAVHPRARWVTDPFAGSGTILTESIMKGLNFFGRDINPLAVLLCRVKAGPFFPDALAAKTQDVLGRVQADRSSRFEVDFPGRNKWFRRDVQISLSRLRRAIVCEKALWARRFFWIALAETVRQTSNSRTSTFKLHTRPSDEIRTRCVDPAPLFRRILHRNLEHLRSQVECLQASNLLERGHYVGDVAVSLGDTHESDVRNRSTYDILITSPPYGDNASTVPYGQYSFLPLHWIDMADVDADANKDYLNSTHEIDSRSLGGSRRVLQSDAASLSEKSPSFRRLLKRLSAEPADRAKRVTAYFRDLNACLVPILRTLRPGGLMVWTLGNRRVAGRNVPLDRILQDLLEYEQSLCVARLRRRISSKRMAPKSAS